jgi:hypothetical protein
MRPPKIRPPRLPKKRLRFMTICAAALAAKSKAIVCVADKAITYGDVISWESDVTLAAR